MGMELSAADSRKVRDGQHIVDFGIFMGFDDITGIE